MGILGASSRSHGDEVTSAFYSCLTLEPRFGADDSAEVVGHDEGWATHCLDEVFLGEVEIDISHEGRPIGMRAVLSTVETNVIA